MGEGYAQAAADTAVAGIYAASNIVSWGFATSMPYIQAKANKEILKLQKEQYDELTKKQRDILNAAISKYLENIDSILASDQFEKAFPDVPVAAEYVPVNVTAVQLDSIDKNLDAAVASAPLTEYINNFNIQQLLGTALAGDSRFMVTLDIQSKSIQDLTRGLLSVGDVVEVLTDNAEQAALTGRIGTTKKTTARDLGISKLRAQVAGRAEFRAASVWFLGSIIPHQRIHENTEAAMTPQQRVDVALMQSQLIQQSLQNKNNQLAQKAPYLMAELQTKLQKFITRLQAKSSEALLMNTHLPNPALSVASGPDVSALGGLTKSIADAFNPASRKHYYGPPGSQDSDASGASGSNIRDLPVTASTAK